VPQQESFDEDCCSGSGRIPRRGAAVLRKATRAKHTSFPEAHARDERLDERLRVMM
jgi:hypothetical protein